MRGLRCGAELRGRPPLLLRAFRDDEDGFTTVAMAVSLLLSLTLAFSAAAAGWVAARSSEVQRVADATALAGSNAVAAFSTIVQVVDACSLSLGLTGLVTIGAGLVASCVPALAPTGAELVATGGRILDARQTFTSSAEKGIGRLEAALPLLVVANSASCVSANCGEDLSYVGCAIPFPLEGTSDFAALAADVSGEELDDLSVEMREESARLEETEERVREARERGWLADCGSQPYCLWERAGTLAGLSSTANPHYSSSDGWTFGAPLARARAYYAARLAAERVVGDTPEELTDAACRRAYYDYALDQVRGGSYVEHADGTVSCDLPLLPRNTEQTRACSLYDDATWPCTDEDGVRTLHCSRSCPGADGPAAGLASLRQLDTGLVARCDTCQMDVGDLGRVAAASTSIENGFEHYWDAIARAAEDYENATLERAEARAALEGVAEQGAESFEEEIGQLAEASTQLRPPGAWGCVAVVARAEGSVVPTELTQAFLSEAELPAGAAVSAATLAPSEATADANVLASFLDALVASDSALAGAVDGVFELWGELLIGYGSAVEGIADVGTEFLGSLDGVLAGSVGSWLRDQLGDVLQAAGLEPVDMRLRRPVLVNTQDVLDEAGITHADGVRELLATLPDSTSAVDIARALGIPTSGASGETELVIAELTLPGTDISVPLSVDLSQLAGVA